MHGDPARSTDGLSAPKIFAFDKRRERRGSGTLTRASASACVLIKVVGRLLMSTIEGLLIIGGCSDMMSAKIVIFGPPPPMSLSHSGTYQHYHLLLGLTSEATSYVNVPFRLSLRVNKWPPRP